MPNSHGHNFGIAFEGCAGKAAFHIGVMQGFQTHGLAPAAVAGASSGAIIAALVALGQTTSLAPLWMDACGQAVFRPGRLLRARWPFVMSDIVGEAVRAHVGDLRLADVPLPLAIAITQFTGGRPWRRALTNADPVGLWDAVLASCFLPGPYARMVPIDGRLTVDGAWLLRTPVDLVPMPPSSRLVACVANPAGHLAGGFFRPKAFPVPANCRVLAPLAPLPVSAFDLGRARQRAAIDIGRDSAALFIDKNLSWLQAEPDTQLSKSTVANVAFSNC